MSTDQYMPVVQQKLQAEFGMVPHVDRFDFINHLSLEIDRLIVEDFPKLVYILYRLDVSETKLREMLDKYVYEDAGYVIAQLVIDRELQKAEQRATAAQPKDDIPEKDKW